MTNSDIDAALATVRHALEDAILVFSDTKWFEAYYESPAALDILAAELERVRAELFDEREVCQKTYHGALETAQARLDSALGALRWVDDMTRGRSGASGISDYVRSELAEIEKS